MVKAVLLSYKLTKVRDKRTLRPNFMYPPRLISLNWTHQIYGVNRYSFFGFRIDLGWFLVGELVSRCIF